MGVFLVGIRISEATDGYINHCRMRKQAENTIRTKRTVLGFALDIWGNIQVQNLEARHIDVFFSAHPEWAPRTTNLYAQTLRSFFKWCRLNRHLPRDEDPMEIWSNVPDDGRERFYIPADRFADLLEVAEQNHPLDRWVIALGLYTLMRGSEIRTLRVDALVNVGSDNPMLRIYRHKTKDHDVIPIPGELGEEAARWFRWLRSSHGIEQPSWFLVPQRVFRARAWNEEKGRWLFATGDHGVDPAKQFRNNYLPVQRAVAALGMDGTRVGVHTLRASAARHLFNELSSMGYDGALRRVQSLLGHKKAATTETYLGLSLEREARNKQFSGKLMFPSLVKPEGDVVMLPSAVNNG